MLRPNLLLGYKKNLVLSMIAWFVLQILFSQLTVFFINKNSNENLFKAIEIINFNSSISFWKSITGICVKMLMEITVTTLLIYSGFLVVGKKPILKIILSIVIIANSVFLVQLMAEYFYLFFNYKNILNLDIERFSFLSVNYFLNIFHVSYPKPYGYAFQVISIFEFIYIFALIYFVKKFLKIRFLDSFKIILISYIFPLTIWLLIISFFSLI